MTRRLETASFLRLAPLLLVACVGYRTPIGARPTQESTGPTSERDAGDVNRPGDLPVDVPPADRPTSLADIRSPDDPIRPADARPADSAEVARRDVPPDRLAWDAPRDVIADLLRAEVSPAAPCPPGREYVLALGGDQTLYRLDPVALTLTELAKAECRSFLMNMSSSLNSLTVSPIGPAYISNHSGDLCRIDLTTLRSESTSFDPRLVGYNSFGMALLPDSSEAGQTLYIAVQSSRNNNYLSRIDLSTYALTGIGTVKPAVPWAELTAGPNGDLYGFAVGDTTSQLLTINPKTGEALDVIEVPAGYVAASFALVYWANAFYLFVGDGRSRGSNVYRYTKGDRQVSYVGSLPVDIIGAGVACSR